MNLFEIIGLIAGLIVAIFFIAIFSAILYFAVMLIATVNNKNK